MGFLSVFLQVTLDTESLPRSSPWGEESHGEWNEQGNEGWAECLGVYRGGSWLLDLVLWVVQPRGHNPPWTDWGSQELCTETPPFCSPIGMCLCSINRQWGTSWGWCSGLAEGLMSVCILK